MLLNGKRIPSPINSKISFHKLLESLETLTESSDENMASYSKQLLEECGQYPDLRNGFEDRKLLKKYKKPIDKLMKLVFPEALLMNEIKGVSGPFDFEPFHLSTRFQNIIDAAGKGFSFEFKEAKADLLYKFACATILGAYYQRPLDLSTPFLFEIPNESTGITRSYRMAFNADMLEISPTGKAIEITEEDYLELLNNFEDTALWKKKFPEGSWDLKGIGILNLMDVTMDASLADITSSLLIKSHNAFDQIKTGIQRIFNNATLDMGIIVYDDEKMQAPVEKANIASLTMSDAAAVKGEEVMCAFLYEQLIEQQHPTVVSDVENFDLVSQSYLSETLRQKQYGSYIIAPLIHEGELLGFLEIGSRKKYEMNTSSLVKIEKVVPILAMAASRFRMEAQNLREAIIQQECTTIHPAVKWRFEDEATKYMIAQEAGGDPVFKDIIFKDVYPLYGQMDIKGSSTIRNEGVQYDLIKQINGIEKVLIKAHQLTKMAVYEELVFRLDGLKADIKDGLAAGSEHQTLKFIENEIGPVFEHLKKEDKTLAKMIEAYEDMLHPELRMVYEMRRSFDESVTRINHNMAAYIDQKQEEAQAIFPHYFERYKTDGVEYNMYIGEAISKDKTFDPIYLRNLRLWQLISMCEMEKEFKTLQKDLSTPLEVASLILVYSTPLAIHFRMDEKRFDVEGAYNARYEIVKKRVDKAHIKGTNERITVPNKIAIIYSNEQDAQEYRMYIKYLEQKNYIKENSLEELELEDLQGISGLRALRVEMNYQPSKKKDGMTVEKVLAEIEKRS